MKHLFFALFYILQITIAFSQDYPSSNSIADCDGAVVLPQKGDINIAFSANPGVFLDLDKYDLAFEEVNSIWLNFTAELSGFLNLNFIATQEQTELLFFKSDKEKICDLVGLGDINIEYKTILENKNLIFSKGNEEHHFLQLKKGESVWVYLNNKNKKSIQNLKGKVHFEVLDKEELENSKSNNVDLRKDITLPTFTLSFKSSIDRSPVISEIIIKNSKNYDALYNASSLMFNLERTLKFDLKVDAIGYFPKDTNFRITELEDLEITLLLDPVLSGSRMTLEGIEFFPESEELTPDGKTKLKRIRDFLALNSNLNIEVQGHVNQAGKNTCSAKRLSKKRAKAVSNYLISSGIDQSRVTPKGYGNKYMIYPEATSPEEKQANRRVEIKIL